MKTFIVRYKLGEVECIKATSMQSTSTTVLFRVGKNLNAVIPLSEITSACDSKSVTKWTETKINPSAEGFIEKLHAMKKAKSLENQTRSSN